MNLQRLRSTTRTSFFVLFLLAPVLDIFRLDLNQGHFVLFGWQWNLGLAGLATGDVSPAQAMLNLTLRAGLPILLSAGLFIWVSWKFGRLYCGWLCPHFSMVETINACMRRAIGKLSLWDRHSVPDRNPDETTIEQHPLWRAITILVAAAVALTWSIVLLTYLLPPAEIYGNLWHGALTRNQCLFIGVGSTLFFIDFTLARHLFCRYACAVGYFQSLAWMGNDRALVVAYERDRAADCASCYSACDHVCPMRLKPRNVKRLMFACTQCGQCVDACSHTQANNPRGPLLTWAQDANALPEAAFDSHVAMEKSQAGTRPIAIHRRQPADSHRTDGAQQRQEG